MRDVDELVEEATEVVVVAWVVVDINFEGGNLVQQGKEIFSANFIVEAKFRKAFENYTSDS